MTHRVTHAGDPFLGSLSALLSPVGDWGSFRPGARAAAVAAVLYRRSGVWHLPFVTRRPDLPSHPGQVGLPGGIVRPGEDAWEAAAREVEEEVGVPAADLMPLGAATPIYAAVTNFSVVPFVCWLTDQDVKFVHDPRELDGVLEVPLARLLEEDAWIEGVHPLMGRYFPFADTIIWGLTARMLADLLPRFREALAGAP